MNYTAIVDCMVLFYRDQAQHMADLLAILQDQVQELQMELRSVQHSFDRVEEYALDQERRCEALHQIINGFIEHTTENMRDDVMDTLYDVARSLNIDLDEVIDLSDVEEFRDII